MKCLQYIWHHCTLFSYTFSGGRCTRFIESSHQRFFRGKKLLKLRFLDYFSKAKTEECDQEDWSVSDKFGIITTSSAAYYLEMGAPVSLKVATKACFGGKKNSGNLDLDLGYFFKGKTDECD